MLSSVLPLAAPFGQLLLPLLRIVFRSHALFGAGYTAAFLALFVDLLSLLSGVHCLASTLHLLTWYQSSRCTLIEEIEGSSKAGHQAALCVPLDR